VSRIKKTTDSKITTKKHHVEEILKCGRDPNYFINTYVKIPHPKKGRLAFKTFPYQDQCLKEFIDHNKIIINKSRQLGLSTLAAAYALWMSIFQRDRNVLVIATKLETAKNFLNKVKTGFDGLPSWLVLPKIVVETKTELHFSNGSKVKAIPTSQDAGRSEALSLLVIDECAWIEGIDHLWVGLQPTLSCIAGDTLIQTEYGLIPIEEFCKGKNIGDYFDLKIPLYGKKGPEYTSKGYVSPDGDTLIITTKHGKRVEVTKKHPLYSLCNTGLGTMIPSKNLKIGDYLRVEVEQNYFGKNNLPSDLAYMLGGYVAEGWFIKDKKSKKYYGISIENTDDGFRDVYLKTKLLEKPFHISPSRRTRLLCYSKKLADKFISLGINPDAYCYQKTTPTSILLSNRKTVANYLSGLFDGDGSVTRRGIVLSSTSKKLIEESALLLNNFGFICNIQHVSPRMNDIGRMMPQGKPLKSLRDSWTITIQRSQFKKFHDEIGFRITRKQEKLLQFSKDFIQDSRKLKLIPVTKVKNSILELLKKSGKTKAWFRENNLRLDKCLDKKSDKRFINQFWLTSFKNILSEKCNITLTTKDQEFFSENIGSFYWDEIVSIVPSKNRTYDFTVPKTHSFLQNGILGSNTGGAAILISSPSGVGTFFHNMWVEACNEQNAKGEGTNGFFPIELPWTVHPERDEAWFNMQKAALMPAGGDRAVAQELLCLEANTKIYTKSGFKKIKNIKVGDEVLSHKGRYKKVTRCFKHKLKKNENLYEMSAPGNRKEPIRISGNHPIHTYKFKLPHKKNAKNYFIESQKNGLVPEFISLDGFDKWKQISNPTRRIGYGCLFPHIDSQNILTNEIKTIDLSLFHIENQIVENDSIRYKRQNKNRHGSNKRFIEVDYNLGRFIGLFAAEGHIEPKRFGFALHHNEYNTLGKFVREFLETIGCTYHDNMRDYSKCYVILTSNKFIRSLVDYFVIPGNARTKYYSENVYKTNPEFIRGLLVGHFEGDGDHPFEHSLYNKLKVVSKSTKMLYQLKTFLAMHGHFARIGFLNNEPSYLELDGLLSLPVEKRHISTLLQENITKNTLNKLTSRSLLIEKEHFVGAFQYRKINIEKEYLERPIVYNIEVEEDNSYVTNCIEVHNCQFGSSGHTFISSDTMDTLFLGIQEPLEKLTIKLNCEMWIWKYPVPEHKYVIGADVASGQSDDKSAFHIIDTNEDEVVAEFVGKITPDKFAEVLVEWAAKYNIATICQELNNHGLLTAHVLKETRYPNLYYEKRVKNIYSSYMPEAKEDEMPGFTTNPTSRDEILIRLENALRNKQLRVYSKRLFSELQTFIYKKNSVSGKEKVQARKGCNDDLVMSLAIACNMFEASGKKSFENSSEAQWALVRGMSRNTQQMDTNTGATTDGFFSLPKSDNPRNPLDLQIEKQRAGSLKHSSQQDMNTPFWKQWGWVYKG
jgi:intein/homing endonuclease